MLHRLEYKVWDAWLHASRPDGQNAAEEPQVRLTRNGVSYEMAQAAAFRAMGSEMRGECAVACPTFVLTDEQRATVASIGVQLPMSYARYGGGQPDRRRRRSTARQEAASMSDSRAPEVSDLGQVTFHIEGPLGIVTLNRPEVLNAQGYELLAQVDQAFDLAQADQAIRVVIVRGAGGVFSAGHDLSPGQQRGDDPLERYNEFKKYNLDLLLKWRDFPKPTIAMVDGYCIYAGWMLAAVMDLVFASDRAQFLGGFVEYNSIPWDLGFRKAKEICFESRFMTAAECQAAGFVSRVFPVEDLERETRAFARRVAENHPFTLRMTKLQINKAQDAQGFRSLLEDSLGDYVAMMFMPGFSTILEDKKRLRAVDLAVRGRRGERYGQDGTQRET